MVDSSKLTMVSFVAPFGALDKGGGRGQDGRRKMAAKREVLGRREAKKADKHERVRKAAWDLFTTKGFAETTTTDVAARAGIAKGTLFLYASDKQDLLFLVMHDRLGRTVERAFATLGPLEGGPLEEQLLHVFGTLFRMYARSPKVALEFVRTVPQGHEGPNAKAVDALTMEFFGRIAGLVGAAQARGEVDPQLDAIRAAVNLFSLYFSALLGWLRGAYSLEKALDPFLKESIALQMRGLQPR